MRSHFYASQQGPIYGQDDSDHWLAEAEAGQSLPGGPAVSSASTGPSPVMLGPNKGTKSQIKDWQRFLVTQGYSIGRSCVDGDYGPATKGATQALGAAVGSPTPTGEVTQDLWQKVSAAWGSGPPGTLTTTQKNAGCPGWNTPSTSSSGGAIAQSNGGTTPQASMAGAFSGRNIAIVGGVALLGIGLLAAMRRRGQGAQGPLFTSWEELEVY